MGLSTVKPWLLTRGHQLGPEKSVHMLLDAQVTSTSSSDFMDLCCTGELEIVLLSHLMPFIRQHHH